MRSRVRRAGPLVALAAVAGAAFGVVLAGPEAGPEGNSLAGTGPARRPATPATVPTLDGRLIYQVLSPPGAPPGGFLFIQDLATGEITEGPRLPVVRDLRSSAAGPGWLVFTVREPGGLEEAYVLRGVGPEEEPVFLARGQQVGWDPGAELLVVSRSHPAPNPACAGGTDQRVVMTSIDVRTGRREMLRRERVRCGNVISVAAGQGVVFYTRVSYREATVDVLVLGRGPRRVIEGHRLLSASPAGDLLVVPWAGGFEEVRPFPFGNVLLYRPGDDSAEPIAGIGSLRSARLLAWSSTGDRAALVGYEAGGRAVRVVSIEPGGGRARPVGPGRISSEPGAAFAEGGAVFAAIEGRLYALVGDLALDITQRAYPPAGPVAWIP